MLEHLTEAPGTDAIPILPLSRQQFSDWLARQTSARKLWIETQGFTGEPGGLCLLADAKGRPERVLFGHDGSDVWSLAHLPGKLGKGFFRLDAELEADAADRAAIAWALAGYQFSRYRGRNGREWPVLAWPEKADRDHVARVVAATALVRDLVNTPASDMGPEELAATAASLAEREGGRMRAIIGENLLHENYPAIHAVGRASPRLPRLIDLRWGDDKAPKVTLVGKGVCFDSGGLDLKSSPNMKLMKKDMGGAAIALGLGACRTHFLAFCGGRGVAAALRCRIAFQALFTVDGAGIASSTG